MAHTQLQDVELRRARALMMIERRIKQAMSIGDIAEEFHVSKKTVAKEIDYAKREGLVAAYEDQIIESLVPAAIHAFKVALENNDSQVALEVLKGVGLLRKQSDKPLTAPAPQEDSLEIHIKRIHGAGTSQIASAAASAFIEGSVSEVPPGSPAQLTPGVGLGGDENRDPVDGGDVGVSALAEEPPFELTSESDGPSVG